MVTREELKGKWNEVKGRLQENWGQLTDDDLRQVEGGTDRLVGAIQRKTGAARTEIENFLERALDEIGSMSQMSRQYADYAMDAVRDGYYRASEQTGEMTHRLGRTISRRPLESVLIAAAIGAVAGCMIFASRRRY